jgi:hypothetical protein
LLSEHDKCMFYGLQTVDRETSAVQVSRLLRI